MLLIPAWLLLAIFVPHRKSMWIKHWGSSKVTLLTEAEHHYYFQKSKLKKDRKYKVIYSFYVTLDT